MGSMTTKCSRRRRAVLTGGLTIALLGVAPTDASATTTAAVDRLAGLDRYATAITVSRDTWANQQAQAVVSPGRTSSRTHWRERRWPSPRRRRYC